MPNSGSLLIIPAHSSARGRLHHLVPHQAVTRTYTDREIGLKILVSAVQSRPCPPFFSASCPSENFLRCEFVPRFVPNLGTLWITPAHSGLLSSGMYSSGAYAAPAGRIKWRLRRKATCRAGGGKGGSQLKRSKKRGKKAGNGGSRFTGLQSHSRRGSQLLGPMHDLHMEVIAWDRDLLPEFLWIASLALGRNRSDWPTLYNQFMDAVDSFCPEDFLGLGLVRDFAMIPEDRRTEFKAAHTDLIHRAFHEPFGRILAFYPDSPAWLLSRGAFSIHRTS